MTQITLRLPESAPLDPSHAIWRDLAPSDRVGVYGTALEGEARKRNQAWFEWAVDGFGGVEVELAAGNEHWDIGGIAPYLQRYRQLVEADPHIVGDIVYDVPLFGLATPGYRYGRMTPVEAARATWPMTQAIQDNGREVYLGESWPVRSWDGHLPIKPYLEEQVRLGWIGRRFTLDVNWWHVAEHGARTQDLVDCREWCGDRDIEFGVVIGSPYFGTGTPTERAWLNSALSHMQRFRNVGLPLRDLDHVIVQAWEPVATIDVMHELLGDVREAIGRPRHEPEPVEPEPVEPPIHVAVPRLADEIRVVVGGWVYGAVKETIADWCDIKGAQRPRMNYDQWWRYFALRELRDQWSYGKLSELSTNSRFNRILWSSLVYYTTLTKSDLGGLRHGAMNAIWHRVIRGKSREEVRALIRGRLVVEPGPGPVRPGKDIPIAEHRGRVISFADDRYWFAGHRPEFWTDPDFRRGYAEDPAQRGMTIDWLTLSVTPKSTLGITEHRDGRRHKSQIQDVLSEWSDVYGRGAVVELAMQEFVSRYLMDGAALHDYVVEMAEAVRGLPVMVMVTREITELRRGGRREDDFDWYRGAGQIAARQANRPLGVHLRSMEPPWGGPHPLIGSSGAYWLMQLDFNRRVDEQFRSESPAHRDRTYHGLVPWLNEWIPDRLSTLGRLKGAISYENDLPQGRHASHWGPGVTVEEAERRGRRVLDSRHVIADWSGGSTR